MFLLIFLFVFLRSEKLCENIYGSKLVKVLDELDDLLDLTFRIDAGGIGGKALFYPVVIQILNMIFEMLQDLSILQEHPDPAAGLCGISTIDLGILYNPNLLRQFGSYRIGKVPARPSTSIRPFKIAAATMY